MSELARTGAMVSMNLRRDRVLVPVWVAAFAITAAASAAATDRVYPDLASRVAGADLVNETPALVALYGRIYDPTSAGEVGLFKLTAMGAALVGLFAGFLVIRHTRADEELGRIELLAAGSVGRFAALAAALATAAISVGAIGVCTAVGLVATGLPVSGSLAFGLSWTVAGLAFAGVGALTAQLTASARAARGLAAVALAITFVLRALGDTGTGTEPGWVSWLSPIGWSQQIRPYAGDRWLVGALSLLFAVAASSAAAALLRHRDLGAGLLPQRQGPAHASVTLRGSVGLAWRLQRAAFIGWSVAFVVLSMVVGQVLTRVGDMLDSPAARQLILGLGGVDQLTQAFLSVELSFIGVFAAAYGISTMLRLSTEETSWRADLVLSTSVGRLRWMANQLLLAMGGCAALMVFCGLSLGMIDAARTGAATTVSDDLLGAVARIPAAWVLIGVTSALYGLTRRAGPLAWAALVGTFLTSEFGPLLDIPQWVRDLSPFNHVPLLPGTEIEVGPLIALCTVAAGFCVLGLAAIRRRDIAAG